MHTVRGAARLRRLVRSVGGGWGIGVLGVGLVPGTAVLIGLLAPSPGLQSRQPSASTVLAPSRPGPTKGATSRCPSHCTMLFQPVSCVLSDGLRRSFGNACQAAAYACSHRLQLMGCAPRRATSVPQGTI